MKKITLLLMAALAALVFSGCVTDGVYGVGKTAYKGGKAVIKEIPFDAETKAKLSTIDTAATSYDAARTVVKSAVEGKSEDANTSSHLTK